jgi:putative chitinase
MPIQLTLPLFTQLTTAPPEFAAKYWPHVQKLFPTYGLNENRNRLAACVAQLVVESNRLQDVEEGLYYKDPLRLATIFRRSFDVNKNKLIDAADIAAATPFARNPKALSVKLYNGFHGRGLIQITWETNYVAYGTAVGRDIRGNPDLLLQPLDAVESACWFLKANKAFGLADAGDIDGVTRIVNPAMMHAAERRAAFYAGLRVLSSV